MIKEGGMSRKRFTAEQIIGLLREAEVKLSQGRQIGQTCRDVGITEQTYYRRRKEYGCMKTVQVRRLKYPVGGRTESFQETTETEPSVAE